MKENHDPSDSLPVTVLPPLEFDFSQGQPLPAKYGKSEAAVTVLPPVPFDFSEAVEVPFLKLTLYLRPDADPAILPLDVLRLIDALSRHERELGGQGVAWHQTCSQATPGSGVVRLVLTPNELHGARERLIRLVATVTASAAAHSARPSELLTNNHSFARWEATVGGAAA